MFEKAENYCKKKRIEKSDSLMHRVREKDVLYLVKVKDH
jgi:pentatricopeptide repeat protein